MDRGGRQKDQRNVTGKKRSVEVAGYLFIRIDSGVAVDRLYDAQRGHGGQDE